ncbi:GNAT family N-acetyltransferase [Flavobacteriaceae bacterium 144Ye]|nr:GNAT family N-acetyltransferase [Flavobacteriaceae bacterium 144Ye]
MTEITLATPNDYKQIADLGFIIWNEHYTPIIGAEQVAYMLEKFQSEKAIQQQVEEGFEYYLITFETVSVGYICVKKKRDALFLSKIYVLSDYRGKKIGKTAIQFVERRANTLHCNSIELTVNKYNVNSIKAYEKLGFKTIEALVMDIGNGFVMDDYRMVKNL